MDDFPTVAEMRRATGHAIACPKPFEHWLAVAKFRRASLRDRVNMAVLREEIERQNHELRNPCHTLEAFGDGDEYYILAVDPDVDTEQVDEWIKTIDSVGCLSEEAMEQALEPEIKRLWKAMSTADRMMLICRVRGHAADILEIDPPACVWSEIADTID